MAGSYGQSRGGRGKASAPPTHEPAHQFAHGSAVGVLAEHPSEEPEDPAFLAGLDEMADRLERLTQKIDAGTAFYEASIERLEKLA